MYPNQFPPPSTGNGGLGSADSNLWSAQGTPFRAADFNMPTFQPAGSGGFAAKYVAVCAAGTLVISTFGLVLTTGSGASHTTSHLDAPLGLAMLTAAFTYLGAVGTWIYKSWQFLPPDMRRTANGRVIGPGEAVGFLFVPLYNLYWFFAQSMGLCEAIDAALVQTGKTPSAPRNLALAASIAQVIPYINWLVAPVLWMVFMFVADASKQRLVEAR